MNHPERPRIILFHGKRTRSGRVKMLLDLMKMPYELRPLDITVGEHKAPAYLAMHPFGVVPTMLYGDQVLLESGAMMMHLADLDPEQRWAPPPGSALRGAYYTWFMLSCVTIEPLAMTYLSQPDSAEAGRSFAHAAQVLNDRITLPYCLPGRLSAVDVMVHWNLRFLLQTKVGAKLERARRYYDGLTSTFDWTDY